MDMARLTSLSLGCVSGWIFDPRTQKISVSLWAVGNIGLRSGSNPYATPGFGCVDIHPKYHSDVVEPVPGEMASLARR